MKKSIKLIVALFAVMLVSVTSVFAYNVEDLTTGALNGNYDKVKKCLDAGVDVNARDSIGTTALYQAAKGNKTTIMKYLISKGASVDRTNKNGYFPLTTAAYRGNLEAVKILVYNGCDVNKTEPDGSTALKYAQEEGHTKVIQFLKEHGAR